MHRADNVKSCWTAMRESKRLVVAVVTLLLMLDVMLITVLEPLLPAMLLELDLLQRGSITWSAWLSSLFRCGGGVGFGRNGTASAEFDEALVYAQYAPQIGLVLGLKPGAEVLGNLLVGPLVDKVGHKVPLLIGSVLYLVTAGLFGLSPSYPILLVARLLQAASSSLSTVSGLALLAATFADDEAERAKAASVAFGGLSFGLIMGFPFGALMAQWLGRASPFLVLSGFSLLDLLLRMAIRTPDDRRQPTSTSASVKEIGAAPVAAKTLWRLASNRYVGTILLADFLIHFGLGAVFTTAPSFMQDALGGSLWQMALVALVTTCLQFVVQYACSCWLGARPLSRCRVLFPSLAVFGLAMILYPMMGATGSIWFAVLPESVLRIAMALFTCTCFPTLNYLTDRLFRAQYGAVNGLYTGAFNLGMFCGSQYAGQLLGPLGLTQIYCLCGLVLVASASIGVVHRNLADVVGDADVCEAVHDDTIKAEIGDISRRRRRSRMPSLGRDGLAILSHSSASGTVV